VHLPIVPFSVAQKTSFCKTIFEFEALFYLFIFSSVRCPALHRPDKKKMKSGFILKNRFTKTRFSIKT